MKKLVLIALFVAFFGGAAGAQTQPSFPRSRGLPPPPQAQPGNVAEKSSMTANTHVTFNFVAATQSMPLTGIPPCAPSGADFTCTNPPGFNNAHQPIFSIGVITNPPAAVYSGTLSTTTSGVVLAAPAGGFPAGCALSGVVPNQTVVCTNLATVAAGTTIAQLNVGATAVPAGTYPISLALSQ